MPPEQPAPFHPRPTVKDFLIPIAIVLAGLILAGAIYAARIKHNLEHGTGTTQAVAPVSSSDHIMGNPTAPVTVIEYADIESSYSKSFQTTMEQLMNDYAKDGKVAWVYRHFPMSIQHPNAGQDALAAECAASLSIPSTFFRFIDAIGAAAPGTNQFDPKNYSLLLAPLGIDQDAFAKCMTAATFEKKIHADYDNALAAGATGSPFIVLLVQGQKPAPINGSIPYPALKKIIDDAVAKLPAS